MNVSITVTGSNLKAEVPFNNIWVEKARNLSGTFNAGVWSFDSRLEKKVREAAYEVFGCDGERVNQCAIELNVSEALWDAWPGRQDAVYFLGRPLARAFGRDSGAKLCEGVVVLSGGFSSGGSTKNWMTIIKPDTNVLLHDMPREAVQALLDLGRGYIKIIEEDKPSTNTENSKEALIADLRKVSDNLNSILNDDDARITSETGEAIQGIIDDVDTALKSVSTGFYSAQEKMADNG